MPCGSNPNYKKMNQKTNPQLNPENSSSIIRKVIGKNPVHLKKGRAL